MNELKNQCTSEDENHHVPASAGAHETSHLLVNKPYAWSAWMRRYRGTHKFISSKAALVILMCSFAVNMIYLLIFNPGNYIFQIGTNGFYDYIPAFYGIAAITLCFYPLAGFLADIKFGRYQTVVYSLQFLIVTFPIGTIAITTAAVYLSFFTTEPNTFLEITSSITIAVVLSIPCLASSIVFNANVIQFGMDQLHDSPGDHQSLFIQWYVWLYSLGTVTVQISFNFVLNFTTRSIVTMIIKSYLYGAIIFIIPVLLFSISLFLFRCKRNWFLIDPARLNPYKFVYKVTKFAWQHKIPLQRSAFTYCEDEIPHGLDLGKQKYGGPFTTEQVEDVKVLYEMLKLLFSLGPMFFLELATGPSLYMYVNHISSKSNFLFHHVSNNSDYDNTFYFYGLQGMRQYLLQNGLLGSIITVFMIPTYICLLRPFISRYLPGMLKRIGLGIFFMVASLLCIFIMDTVIHVYYNGIGCMFDTREFIHTITHNNTESPFPNISVTYTVIVLQFLSSLSYMLIYIALFEFICSQSPHSMKGLLIGLSFAIKGLFQIAAAVMLVPFFIKQPGHFPSCGMYYYLINICVGLIALVVYTCIARRYKWRQRDEPDNVYRYAEEYYSNIRDSYTYN